jgi:hypothetical protein
LRNREDREPIWPSVYASLDKRLEFYLGESRSLLPDLEATYDKVRSNQDMIKVPLLGETLPDFFLSSKELVTVD